MNGITDVLILDDSPICLHRLRAIVEADGDLRVAGELRSGRDVLPALARLHPQVLVTDLVMPETDGLAVVSEVMASHPIPIIVVSGGGVDESSAFEATRRGALEVATKPALGDHGAAAALRVAIRRVAPVPVVRHPGLLATPVRPPPVAASVRWQGASPTVLGIGASAGGPAAIVDLITELDPERAPAIMVAQHLPVGQAEGFARFLADRCHFEVVVCRGTAALAPGRIVVPTDSMHLVVLDSGRAAISKPDIATLYVPSVDVLFASLAATIGVEAAGVVLTGIGQDGALGLRALHAQGALTLAQDEASSMVYGMPRAAAPAARFQLPPREIARVITAAVARRAQGRGS